MKKTAILVALAAVTGTTAVFPASDYINPVYERCANDLSPFDKDSL